MPRKKSTPTVLNRVQTLKDNILENLGNFPRVKKTLRWSVRIVIALALIDTGYIMAIWPDWKWYTDGPIPESQFIQAYERQHYQDRSLPRLRWKTIDIDKIPQRALRVFLAAEDSRFFKHGGIDTESFRRAMEYNWQQKRFVYGASTISQQTVKNLFLSPSRDPFRKWHELLLTFAMENELTKRRILELYLNVAEFGTGIYGIEAACQKYFGISASKISPYQAAELAATLPAPKNHNPRTRSNFFLKHKKKILRNAGLG